MAVRTESCPARWDPELAMASLSFLDDSCRTFVAAGSKAAGHRSSPKRFAATSVTLNPMAASQPHLTRVEPIKTDWVKAEQSWDRRGFS